MQLDYLIAGSGLTGSVIARRLFDSGARVLVLDRRSAAGGNVRDEFHSSGILMHTYGPHYFRTSSDQIWKFLNRFSSFYPFEARLRTMVDGVHERWPVAEEYINRCVGKWECMKNGEPGNFEEASLAMMPRVIYEKFIKGYSEKQWGVPAESLAPELAGRFDVRRGEDDRLKTSRYQGLPENGYSGLIREMLRGIPLLLNASYFEVLQWFTPRKLTIFTGPIDEFFGFHLGRLCYRGQERESVYLPDKDRVQPVVQVNFPSPEDGRKVRTIEWKHLMQPRYAERIKGTLLTSETPFSPKDPDKYEYPMPDSTNQRLYQAYRHMALDFPQVAFCGRLGEYRYLDMDHAIARALAFAGRLIALHGESDPREKIISTQESLDALAEDVLNDRV